MSQAQQGLRDTQQSWSQPACTSSFHLYKLLLISMRGEWGQLPPFRALPKPHPQALDTMLDLEGSIWGLVGSTAWGLAARDLLEGLWGPLYHGASSNPSQTQKEFAK